MKAKLTKNTQYSKRDNAPKPRNETTYITMPIKQYMAEYEKGLRKEAIQVALQNKPSLIIQGDELDKFNLIAEAKKIYNYLKTGK